LYKWVDQGSVTNYSEFQPKEGASRKVEVLESRGEHVDPAMMVTAEMKAIEIPDDQTNPLAQSPSSSVQPNPQVHPQTTQTVAKQGAMATPYARPPNTVAPVTPTTEKKEPQQVAQQPHPVEKKEVVANPFIEKPSSTVVAVEKKEDVVAVQPEKKVQPKINPWTRQVEFVPSNLVPQNLSKGSSNP
jgi:FtsZ-interacting cell division protein ZipA